MLDYLEGISKAFRRKFFAKNMGKTFGGIRKSRIFAALLRDKATREVLKGV